MYQTSRKSLSVFPAVLLIGTLGLTAEPQPPNVVLIISDDQGWGDYGFMGHPVIETPHLDRLASQSLVFTRGYVPSSLCRPSLASIATGLYPHQHRITSNDPPRGARAEILARRRRMIEIFEGVPTLSKLLAQKGYVSHQSGKWWEGHHTSGGFTAGMTHGDPKRGGRHGDEGLKIGRESMDPIFNFIEGAGSKPFFIWYAPFLPHTPHNPPQRILEKYTASERPLRLARYYAMCDWFDETCGELLDFLERKNLAANTVVAYVTDNGWIQRTARTTLPSGWGLPHSPKSKRSPYDGGLRTPIMLRWPGKIAARRDNETLVSSIDLAPTILTACGLQPAPQMQGVHLLDPEALKRREAVFGAVFTHDAVNIESPATSLMYRWCLKGRLKLILPHFANVPDRQAELYDVIADPHETKDLFEAQPEQAAELKASIDGWWSLSRARKAG